MIVSFCLDQVIPQGLHIRINLSTGLKEAKLLTPENKENALSVTENKNINDEISLNVDELKAKIRNIKNEDSSSDNEIKQKFRTMEELKELMKNNNVGVKTELEMIRNLIGEYKNLKMVEHDDIEKASVILQDLEYLVHKFDNGLEFINLEGIEFIIKPNLENGTEKLTIQTLELLGASLQNNKNVKQLIFEDNIGEKLLQLIERGPNKIKNKAVYTLGCLVRDFPHAQQKLIVEIGSSIFRKILNDFENSDMKVKLRIITLLQDLANENSTLIDINNILQITDYCSNIENLIIDSKNSNLGNHDNIEKLLKALNTNLDFCKNNMPQSNYFKTALLDLSIIYSNLAHEEKLRNDHDSYYLEILSLIESLRKDFKINRKQEL